MGRVTEPRAVSRLRESSDARCGDRVIVSPGYWRVATLISSAVTMALVGLFVACGGGGGGGGGGESCSSGCVNLEPFLASRDSADLADCSCRVARGLVSDFDECMTEIAPSIDKTSLCLTRVADEHTSVQGNLDCAVQTEEDLAACLGESNCSEDDFNACFDDYDLVYADCPQITDLVFQELNDCF